MNDFSILLTEQDKASALAIVEIILSSGNDPQVINVCCYGDFVNDLDMTVFSVGTLAMKAIRAIKDLGGERYQAIVDGFGCEVERREQFDDYIARQCFLQRMAWAGSRVRQND